MGTTLGFLILAAALEIGGDAAIRCGLLRSTRAPLLLGVVLLVAYGFAVNSNRSIDFGRLLGVYIAVFFVVSQIVGMLVFGERPGLSVMAGGALIVAGGAVVFLDRAEAGDGRRMRERIQCGIYLPNFGPFGEAHRVAELAADAEAAGWDGCFIWDHIARPFVTDLVDPWVALAAIAQRTTRIRFGALITPLARRRPWQVARATVSIDRLSGGRLVFGAGIGSGRSVEWDDFGEAADPRTRSAMLDEALQVLSGLWSGQPFAFEGRYYRVRHAQFAPVAVQTPRIPVWVAGHWPQPAPFRRAARWDGIFPEFPRGGDELAQLRALRAYVAARRVSAAPFDVVYATAPRATAQDLAAYAAAGATWWLARLEPPHFGAGWDGAWPLAAMQAYVTGGPPPCAS